VTDAIGHLVKAAPATRRALRARGLAPLRGVCRVFWARLLREEGVPAETWPTLQEGGHPLEPVEDEVWAPEWAARLLGVAYSTVSADMAEAPARHAVRAALASEDLRRALAAEDALGSRALALELLAGGLGP
jgi:hypothetical protein